MPGSKLSIASSAQEPLFPGALPHLPGQARARVRPLHSAQGRSRSGSGAPLHCHAYTCTATFLWGILPFAWVLTCAAGWTSVLT